MALRAAEKDKTTPKRLQKLRDCVLVFFFFQFIMETFKYLKSQGDTPLEICKRGREGAKHMKANTSSLPLIMN